MRISLEKATNFGENMRDLKNTISDHFTTFFGKTNIDSVKNVGSKLEGVVGRNKNVLLITIMAIIIFIVLGLYVYRNNIKSLLDKQYVANKEYVDTSLSEDVIIYLFYTEWCPHCKTALAPESPWNSFKNYIKDTATYDQSYNIIFQEVNCDKEPSVANRYDIKAYPTIKILYNNKIYNYEAKPDEKHLLDFLDGTLTLKQKGGWFS